VDGHRQNGAGLRKILFIRSRGYVLPVRCEDLIGAARQGSRVRSRTTREKFLVPRTLSLVEQQLPSKSFLRIHRSTLINLRFVKRLAPWFSGGYTVHPTTGEEFKLSKKYAADLFDRFGAP